jgi:hypothetical protein
LCNNTEPELHKSLPRWSAHTWCETSKEFPPIKRRNSKLFRFLLLAIFSSNLKVSWTQERERSTSLPRLSITCSALKYLVLFVLKHFFFFSIQFKYN